MKRGLQLVLITAMFLVIVSMQQIEVKALDVSEEYKVTFDPANGEEVQQILLKKGQQLEKNQVPFQDLLNGNKDFLGWYYGDGAKYELIFPYTLDKDIVFSAKWGNHQESNPVKKMGYRMIFNDEFDSGEGTLNPERWVDKYLSSWTRTPELAKPVYNLEDGVMSLQIKEDTQPWAPEYDGQTVVSGFTTGNRNGLHNWNKTNIVRNPVETEVTHINQYGYYEMRAKTQAGSSRHAAWWLVGFEDEPTHSAEIDIFEVLGNDKTGVPRAFHIWNDTTDPFGPGGNGTYRDTNADFHNEWHVYGFDWQQGTGAGEHPDKLVLYVDGKEVGSKNVDINYPMIQLFSLYEKRAGGWTGNWEWMPYPNSFDIDYVRVYKKLPDGQQELSKEELQITSIEDSQVKVVEGQAKLETYVSKVAGSLDQIYQEPNLPNTKSYVNVTWNDGVVTQEFVKWDPITVHDLEMINNGQEVLKKGVLPNVANVAGLTQPSLLIRVVQGPPYTSENLGTTNNQLELAKLFDGDLAANSGEFRFASAQLPADKEVNIQYDFRKTITLQAMSFSTNYGQDQGIKKFKLATWDTEKNSWTEIDNEYELAWTPAGNTELGETLTIEIAPLKTTKLKIIITDAGLTWSNKMAMRELQFDYTENHPNELSEDLKKKRAKLEKEIVKASIISNSTGDYTAVSYSSLQAVIKEAENVLHVSTEIADVEKEIDSLKEAVKGLMKVKEWKKEITKFDKKIKNVESISNGENKYTEDSFSALQQAIKVASGAINTVTTEAELKSAIAALEKAIDNLEKRKNK